jgi:hypothetical protein
LIGATTATNLLTVWAVATAGLWVLHHAFWTGRSGRARIVWHADAIVFVERVAAVATVDAADAGATIVVPQVVPGTGLNRADACATVDIPFVSLIALLRGALSGHASTGRGVEVISLLTLLGWAVTDTLVRVPLQVSAALLFLADTSTRRRVDRVIVVRTVGWRADAFTLLVVPDIPGVTVCFDARRDARATRIVPDVADLDAVVLDTFPRAGTGGIVPCLP